MANRSDPHRLPFPSIQGRVIVVTFRGQVRIRAWPRKRGKKATPQQKLWREWFAKANRLAVRAPASQLEIAMRCAKGTGLYPRDILLKAMSTGFFDVITQEGDHMTHRWKVWEPVVYQGATTYLAANLPVSAGLLQTIQWPLPQRDTMGFWSAGDPTRLTIPDHVEIVRLTFTLVATAATAGAHVIYLRKNGSELIARQETNGSLTPWGTIESAPLLVSTGDYFEAQVFNTNAATAAAGQASSFALTVLQAS